MYGRANITEACRLFPTFAYGKDHSTTRLDLISVVLNNSLFTPKRVCADVIARSLKSPLKVFVWSTNIVHKLPPHLQCKKALDIICVQAQKYPCSACHLPSVLYWRWNAQLKIVLLKCPMLFIPVQSVTRTFVEDRFFYFFFSLFDNGWVCAEIVPGTRYYHLTEKL